MASGMVFAKNRAPVVASSYFVPMATTNCVAHSELAIANFLGRKVHEVIPM